MASFGIGNSNITEMFLKTTGQIVGVAAGTASIPPNANKAGDSINKLYYGNTKLYERTAAKVTLEYDDNINWISTQFSGQTARYLYGAVAGYVERGASVVFAGYEHQDPLNDNFIIKLKVNSSYNLTFEIMPKSGYYISTFENAIPETVADDFRIKPTLADQSSYVASDYATITVSKGTGIYRVTDGYTSDISTIIVPKNSTITTSGHNLKITKPDGNVVKLVASISTSSQYTYSFDSWNAPATVTGDFTLNPTTTATVINYTVSFGVTDNGTLASQYASISVPYGTPIIYSNDGKTITINGNSYTGTIASNPDENLNYTLEYGWGEGEFISSHPTTVSGNMDMRLGAIYAPRSVDLIFLASGNYVIDSPSEEESGVISFKISSCNPDSLISMDDGIITIKRQPADIIPVESVHTFTVGFRNSAGGSYWSNLEYSKNGESTWNDFGGSIQEMKLGYPFGIYDKQMESDNIWIRVKTT